jgi:hypothetical protein
LGKAHWIHAAMNNHQAEHQYTIPKMSGTIANQKFSFYVEMDLGVKQKVGGKVTDCSLNLGDFVMKSNMYVMILRSYDVAICMDWLELHEVVLNLKKK